MPVAEVVHRKHMGVAFGAMLGAVMALVGAFHPYSDPLTDSCSETLHRNPSKTKRKKPYMT